jgi:hypothetical protein
MQWYLEKSHMPAITFNATIAADGMLHLAVPGARPGAEVEVSITQKPNVNDNGWPADFHEKMFGCITDDTFVRHPQPQLPPAATLD